MSADLGRRASKSAAAEGDLPESLARLLNCLGSVLLDRGGKAAVGPDTQAIVESMIPLLCGYVSGRLRSIAWGCIISQNLCSVTCSTSRDMRRYLLDEDDGTSEQVLEFAGLYTQLLKVRECKQLVLVAEIPLLLFKKLCCAIRAHGIFSQRCIAALSMAGPVAIWVTIGASAAAPFRRHDQDDLRCRPYV